MIIPVRSSSGDYDPWMDVNEDGKIDLDDYYALAQLYGTSGESINKTALLLELQARVDELNTTVAMLQEQIALLGQGTCAIETKMTTGNQITITFPEGMFTNPPDLSATIYVMTGLHAGKTCRISSQSVSATYAKLSLQAWDGATWQDIADSEFVQVSYTAIETP